MGSVVPSPSSGSGAESSSSSRAPVHVVKALMKSQITGKGFKSLRSLPAAVYQRLNSSTMMADFCLKLEAHVKLEDLQGCKNLLQSIARKIYEHGDSQSSENEQNREGFILCGGDVLLMKILGSSCAPRSSTRRTRSIEVAAAEILSIRNDCLGLLRELCYNTPYFLYSLCVHEDFVVSLFKMMEQPETFMNAVGLAEEILASREDVLNLRTIPNFTKLVTNLNARQLCLFCRVLANVVFEPEERIADGGVNTGKESAGNAKTESSPETPVADINHEILLNTPDFLFRLVKLLYVRQPPSQGQVSQQLVAQLHAIGLDGGDAMQPLLGMDLGELEDWETTRGRADSPRPPIAPMPFDPDYEQGFRTVDGEEDAVSVALGDGGAGTGAGLGNLDDMRAGETGGGGLWGSFWRSRLWGAREDASTTSVTADTGQPPLAPLLPQQLLRRPARGVARAGDPVPEVVPQDFDLSALLDFGRHLDENEGYPMRQYHHHHHHHLHQLPWDDDVEAMPEELQGMTRLLMEREQELLQQQREAEEAEEAEVEVEDEEEEEEEGQELEQEEMEREAEGVREHARNFVATLYGAVLGGDGGEHSSKVEVLFVLCALCGGKRKEYVQDKLAYLGLVPVLVDMFDKLDWQLPQPPAPEPHGIHGPGCACNPQSALKIQYLRLLHNFCDRDGNNRTNKDLLMKPLRPQSMTRPDARMLHVARSRSSPSSFFGARNNDNAHHHASSGSGDARSLQRSSTSPPQHQPVEDGYEGGLMRKVLHLLMNEPGDSVYRFWLASCVEAFLRGADPRDQEYVASTGLMEHLLEEILKGGFKCAPTLQINFDLLGELIKFNPKLFSQFNNQLLKGKAFNRLVEVIVTHLVDSNVFIRAIILSLESFRMAKEGVVPAWVGRRGEFADPQGRWQAGKRLDSREGPGSSRSSGLDTAGACPPSSSSSAASSSSSAAASSSSSSKPSSEAAEAKDAATGFSLEGCQITAFMACNTLRLLRDLMCAVRPGDINQDNICVLNTALIFFILAERNGSLLAYLQALRSADIGGPSGGVGSVVRNFRTLLDFWKDYYARRKGRDRTSLEYSTAIPFSEWERMVEILCDDPEQPTSLLHIPPGGTQCATLSASGEPPRRRC